jgi:two-component system cell cycle sensor histidine kinase/response regulator CckA
MVNTPANSRTILIVDDEEMVLTLGRIILERRGYRVILALSGAQALEVCQDPAQQPDCIIIDYTMPVMNGRDTLIAIRKILPSVPAIISSGYSDDEISEEMAGIDVSGVIHKPYRQESMIAALNSAVAASETGIYSGHIIR